MKRRNSLVQMILLSALAAGALALSYVELLLPPLIAGLPGIKMGLPNIIIIFCLYRLGGREAALVSGLRLVLSALLFGSAVTFIYSLAGAVLSLFLMLLLRRSGIFSPIGVSIAGGVAHNAGQVLVAKLIGAGRKERLGRFVGTMSTFLLGSAILLTILGLLLQRPILGWMQTPSEAYDGARWYSLVSILGLVFIYGYNLVSAILRGMGDSKHPFIFISIAALVNVVLDVVFVVFLGMGAAGAALATVVSQAISFLSCTVFIVRRRERFSLDVSLRDFLLPDREMLGELLKLGIPMAIKTASIQVSKLFVNAWINSYGLAESAFSGIANKIANVSNLVSTAIGSTTASSGFCTASP